MALARTNPYGLYENKLPEKLCLEDKLSSGPTVKVVFHTFSIGDVEDPEIYASMGLSEWRKTERGIWCWENSIGPIHFHSMLDTQMYSYKVAITGELSPENFTYYKLKWGIC